LLVKDTKGEFDFTRGKFSEEELMKPPMIPKVFSWFQFWLNSKLNGGLRPDQFVNLCKEVEISPEDDSIQA